METLLSSKLHEEVAWTAPAASSRKEEMPVNHMLAGVVCEKEWKGKCVQIDKADELPRRRLSPRAPVCPFSCYSLNQSSLRGVKRARAMWVLAGKQGYSICVIPTAHPMNYYCV